MTARVHTLAEMRALTGGWRREGSRIGFVPTMGALHDGHIKLVEAALAGCERVVVSIFVNPAQFAPHEDLEKYPRPLEADMERLASAGAHAAWLPDVAAMYPQGFASKVSVAGVTAPLEGTYRPQFFDGVATVVTKLFNQVMPDAAYFGEKDYQQLLTVTRMTRDLDLPVEIVPVPTVRDAQGLALSSRNTYLDPAQLAVARRMNTILAAMAGRLQAGETPEAAEAWGAAQLLEAGFTKVDYCAVRDAATLEAYGGGAGRILAAAFIGPVRLIDNLPVK